MTRILAQMLFLCLLSTTVLAQTSDKTLVKKAFDRYKSAILNDRGDEAATLVDSRTIRYYTDILESVRNADSVTVESLSILDKLMVLVIRHKASKEEIRSFTGTSLLSYAVQNGMVGKSSVIDNTVGNVSVDRNFAKAEFISKGEKTDLFMQFYKESGQWKIDLTALFPASTFAFRKFADESGQSEDDFLFSILEMLTSRKPGREVWQPAR